MNIQFFGCGNMGEVILQACIETKETTDTIYVYEKDETRAKYIQQKYDINGTLNPEADLIILAVKPQQFEEIDISRRTKHAVVCSMMAGISIEAIQAHTQHPQAVRIMPNISIQAGQGVIGIYTGTYRASDTIQKLLKICAHKASVITLDREEQIDQITALSGSGPAYFYYFTEQLQAQAQAFGFSPEQAQRIAQETFIGAAKLLEHKQTDAKTLREQVTSKGGTTQAALEHMHDMHAGQHIQHAIQKAYQRAKELSSPTKTS